MVLFKSKPAYLLWSSTHHVNMGVAQCFGYIGASIWLMTSTLVMAVLLAIYAPHVRSLFYPQTMCTIQDAVYTTQYRCECGKGCRSLYPCLAVHACVNSSMVPDNLRVWPYRVFLDDWKYISSLKGDPDTAEAVSALFVLCGMQAVIQCLTSEPVKHHSHSKRGCSHYYYTSCVPMRITDRGGIGGGDSLVCHSFGSFPLNG